MHRKIKFPVEITLSVTINTKKPTEYLEKLAKKYKKIKLASAFWEVSFYDENLINLEFKSFNNISYVLKVAKTLARRKTVRKVSIDRIDIK